MSETTKPIKSRSKGFHKIKEPSEIPKPQPGKFPVLIPATMHATLDSHKPFSVAVPQLDDLSDSIAHVAKTKVRRVDIPPRTITAAGLIAMSKKLLVATDEVVFPNSLVPVDNLKFEIPNVVHSIINTIGLHTTNGIRYVPQRTHVNSVRALLTAALIESQLAPNTLAAWNATRTLSHDPLTDSWVLPHDFAQDWSPHHIDALNDFYNSRDVVINVPTATGGNNVPMNMEYPELPNVATVLQANVDQFLTDALPAPFVQGFPNPAAVTAAYIAPLQNAFGGANGIATFNGWMGFAPAANYANGMYTISSQVLQAIITKVARAVYPIMETIKTVSKCLPITGLDATGSPAQHSVWNSAVSALESSTILASSDVCAGVVGNFVQLSTVRPKFVTPYIDRLNAIQIYANHVFA